MHFQHFSSLTAERGGVQYHFLIGLYIIERGAYLKPQTQITACLHKPVHHRVMHRHFVACPVQKELKTVVAVLIPVAM